MFVFGKKTILPVFELDLHVRLCSVVLKKCCVYGCKTGQLSQKGCSAGQECFCVSFSKGFGSLPRPNQIYFDP